MSTQAAASTSTVNGTGQGRQGAAASGDAAQAVKAVNPPPKPTVSFYGSSSRSGGSGSSSGSGDKAQAYSDETSAFVPGPILTVKPTSQGSLDGLTFGVKDLIDVAGHVTGGGNPDWQRAHGPAARSSPSVELLLAAGATLSGVTITDELAFSLEGVNAHYGTPLNTVCPDRIPGGSSSGSASAVAASLVDFALGTDTGGSVRIPSSFCGLFGMRPTHNAISTSGVVPFAPSYDTVGWFARDAATLAKVGDVLLPKTTPAPVTRFVLVQDAFAIADPEVSAALRAKAALLGITEEISVYDGEESSWLSAYRVLQGVENWQELGQWITETKTVFGSNIAPRFADAATITAEDAARCNPLRQKYTAHVNKLLADGTVFVLPTSPCIALRKGVPGEEIGAFYQRALTLTSIAGHAGLPQISLPVDRVNGAPIGLSIVAARNQDRALLEVATRWAATLSK